MIFSKIYGGFGNIWPKSQKAWPILNNFTNISKSGPVFIPNFYYKRVIVSTWRSIIRPISATHPPVQAFVIKSPFFEDLVVVFCNKRNLIFGTCIIILQILNFLTWNFAQDPVESNSFDSSSGNKTITQNSWCVSLIFLDCTVYRCITYCLIPGFWTP